MTTLATIVEQVRTRAYGYNRPANERIGSLAENISATDAQFDLTTAVRGSGTSIVAQGMAEIGTEKVYIQQVVGTNVSGVIRNYGAPINVGVSHPLGTAIVSNPKYYRADIKDDVNYAINALNGVVHSYGVTSFTGNNRYNYALPANTREVVSVKIQSRGPYPIWRDVDAWEFDQASTDFSTGKALILGMLPQNYNIKVVYATALSTFASYGTDITATGLLEEDVELLVTGALFRTLFNTDASQLNNTSVSQSATAQNEQSKPQTGAAIANNIYSQYAQALARVELRERKLHPVQPHRMLNA